MPSFSDLLQWLNQGAQGGSVPGTQDNPLLQPGEEGAVIGSRPVPGSADRNTFGREDTPAPYNPPGVADDRAMSIGDLLGFGQDQTQYQRPQPQFPQNWPFPFDMYSGPHDGPPVDFSYPPARQMVPANEIAASDAGKYGGQTTTYMQPQFPDYSDLARTLSNYRWRAGGNDSAPIPEQYSGDIPPTLLPDFMRLVQSGLPPDVAHAIMTQPSFAEGERAHTTPQWEPTTPYRGGEPDPMRGGRAVDPYGPYGDEPPMQAPGIINPQENLRDRLTNKRQNFPTAEGHTPGDDDNLGLLRLPNGQYVPAAPPGSGSALEYYRQRGNPNSFYWNPPPGYVYGGP